MQPQEEQEITEESDIIELARSRMPKPHPAITTPTMTPLPSVTITPATDDIQLLTLPQLRALAGRLGLTKISKSHLHLIGISLLLHPGAIAGDESAHCMGASLSIIKVIY